MLRKRARRDQHVRLRVSIAAIGCIVILSHNNQLCDGALVHRAIFEQNAHLCVYIKRFIRFGVFLSRTARRLYIVRDISSNSLGCHTFPVTILPASQEEEEEEAEKEKRSEFIKKGKIGFDSCVRRRRHGERHRYSRSLVKREERKNWLFFFDIFLFCFFSISFTNCLSVTFCFIGSSFC